MVEVQIMHMHDFMSVEEGFSMLLSEEFAAQDLLPVGSAFCDWTNYSNQWWYLVIISIGHSVTELLRPTFAHFWPACIYN